MDQIEKRLLIPFVILIMAMVFVCPVSAKTCKTHAEAQNYIYKEWKNRFKTCEYTASHKISVAKLEYDIQRAFDKVRKEPQYAGLNWYYFEYRNNKVKIRFKQSYKNEKSPKIALKKQKPQ